MKRSTARNTLVVAALLLTSLVNLVVAESPELKSAETQTAEPINQVHVGHFIHLKIGSFDPLQNAPRVPQSLAYKPAEALETGVYIVQFNGPVMPAWKQMVLEAGGQLGSYLPNYAFLAKLDAAALEQVQDLAFVRWVGPYQPAYKLAPDADYNDTRSYRVVLAPWTEAGDIQVALNDLTNQVRGYQGGFSAVLSGEQLGQVARLADVVWIEPVYLQHLHNDVGGGTIMGGSTAWSNGYTGDGVTICVADTGLDTGNLGTIHQDFSGRVAHLSSWPVLYANYGGGCEITNAGADDGASDVDSGHGTHVTGSVAGNGARSSRQFKGLAYEASITMQAVEQLTALTPQCGVSGNQAYLLSGIPDDPGDLLQEAYDWGARIHNNSWGGGEFGVYDQQSAYFDAFLHDHDDMLVVTSVGNSGEDADNDGYVDENSVRSPAAAKNVLTVGASDNERATGGLSAYTWAQAWPSDFGADPTGGDYISDDREELAAFSSRGPMLDGRIKPDVVAPGTNILSVRSSLASGSGWGAYDQYYMYMGGTSMASSLTASAAALVRDYYIDAEGHANPSAALVKATLINTAVDVDGYGNTSQEAGQPIPNNHEGWGRVDVAAATFTGARQFVDETTGIDTGTINTYNYGVQTNQPLRISLVWSDYPGTTQANPALVNNLNLRVTAPDGTTQYWGNVFSGGWSQIGGSADSINNVENVYVQSPMTGTWTVEVIGQNVPQGPQPFALVINGNLEESSSVTDIQPDSAFNNAYLTDTIVSGSGFEATSQVALVLDLEIISGTNLVVNSDTDIITADFNLNYATPGLWDVRVTNIDVTATMEDAFTVMDANLPNFALSKQSHRSVVQAGDPLTYTLRLTNTGLVTFTPTITDILPNNVAPGGAIVWTPSPLTPDDVWTQTVTVTIDWGYSGTLINILRVGTEEGVTSAYTETTKVVLTPPGVPALLYPPNGCVTTTQAITFGWTAGAGNPPVGYNLDLDGSVVTTTANNLATLLSIGAYTWTVRAVNQVGYSDWAAPWTIVVTETSRCTQVTSLDLTQAITGTFYAGDEVAFQADLAPDDTAKPYTYTVYINDQTLILPSASTDDPLIFSHTFPTSGTFTVHFAAWNCGMSLAEAISDTTTLKIIVPDYTIYLPVVVREI